MEYAGFWIRFVAKFVDGLILMVPFVIYGISAGLFSGSLEEPSIAFQLVLQLAFYALGLAYNTFFLGRYGATPGKMACKIRVITAEGGRVSYARALGRALAEILSGMICYIGYIMAGFDPQHRALHDHICNTRVVRE
jgi:uncharacterized RDD family membrane protein YckC